MYNFCFEPSMDPSELDEAYIEAYEAYIEAYNDRQAYYNRYYDEEGDI